MRVRSMVGAVLAAGVLVTVAPSAGAAGPEDATSGAGVRPPDVAATWPPAPTSPSSASPSSALGAAGPEWASDAGFDVPWVHGLIRDLLVRDDGSLIVAGEFDHLGGFARSGFARITPDHAVDPTLGASGAYGITTLADAGDDAVLVGGLLPPELGHQGVVRLHDDGTVDSGFVDPQVDGQVEIARRLPDGRVIVGGWFSSVGGQPRHGLAVLHEDGTLDASVPDLEITGGPVRDVHPTADGLLVAGGFTSVAGSGHPSLFRLLPDATVDPAFTSPTIGPAFALRAITDLDVADDGRIVIGGSFDTIDGQAHDGVALLGPDGGLDPDFVDPALDTGGISRVVVQPDQRVLVAGSFSQAGGTAHHDIVRLELDGSVDPTLIDPLLNGAVMDLALQPDGSILVVGDAGMVEGRSARAVTRLYGTSVPRPGSLDPSFAAGGVAQARFAGSEYAMDIALLPGGGAVTVGSATGRGGRLSVVRLDAQGEPDPGFGGDGGVQTNFTSRDDFAEAVAVQADGKIVAAGVAGAQGTNPVMAVARFLPSGALDPSFGGDGKVTIDFGTGFAAAFDVVVQPNGRIVVAGEVGGQGGRFGLARLRQDGSLDRSFSTDGRTTTNVTAVEDWPWALALQPDGMLLAVGAAGLGPSTKPTLEAIRYRADGSLDRSFAQNGRLAWTFSNRGAIGTAVALDPGGGFVVAGFDGSAGGRMAVARFDSDGIVDPTFGSFGSSVVDFGSGEDAAWDVAIQADGRIVVVGYSDGLAQVALARLGPTGALDQQFDADGRRVDDLSPGADVGFAVALRPDGRILVAGGAGATASSIFLAQYLAT